MWRGNQEENADPNAKDGLREDRTFGSGTFFTHLISIPLSFNNPDIVISFQKFRESILQDKSL
jgi:hypothetical protein